MPELPEVETICRGLSSLIIGEVIEDVCVDPNTLGLLVKGSSLADLKHVFTGSSISRLERRGKYLIFSLDNGFFWIAHLRMTGQIVWTASDDPPLSYQRAVLSLKSGFDLRWADLRKFGTWQITKDLSELDKKLGPEPLDKNFTVSYLRHLVENRVTPIKSLLLDQRYIAGLGNIYVDESLYQARIRPDTPSGQLSRQAIGRLHKACCSVIELAIEHGGASFSDYVDAHGHTGKAHMYVQVFRREGKNCYQCGTVIKKIRLAGRGTHFCSFCQRAPRRHVS